MTARGTARSRGAARVVGVCGGMALLSLGAMLTLQAASPRFLPDDPIAREPDPADSSHVQPFDIHLSWDLISSLFVKEGDAAVRPAQDINTIGEVPDSSWFTNRAGARPLTDAEVRRGPDTSDGPAPGPWTVVSGKSEGIRPGFTITDAAGIEWFLKFDPPGYPEQATSAEVVSTKLFWALGYHVAETHIATLRRENLVIGPTAHITVNGRRRALTQGDVTRVLVQCARNPDGSYRALASRQLEGKPVGEFLYYGTRADDPNDVVPHEHRRELRGMVAAAAWIDRVDAKAGNTLDTLVTGHGPAVVRHHVLDFGSTLGSGGIGPNEYWEGHEYLFDGHRAARRLLTFGLPLESWRLARYPTLRGIGTIESARFDPTMWKSRVPNAAYVRADAEDLFWAAVRITAISDSQIAAAVESGHYTDPAATRYLTQTLIARRDAIGRAYLPAITPIVSPVLDASGVLRVRNAAVDGHAAAAPEMYTSRWWTFDNATGETGSSLGTRDDAAGVFAAPAALPTTPGAFIRVDVSARSAAYPSWGQPVQFYFRRDASGWTWVGMERTKTATGHQGS